MLTVSDKRKHVYEYIRKEALLGRFRGKRTTESQIAKKFGVNRSVARQAFLKLRREGILASRKRFGTFTKEHTDKELFDYYNLRMALEIVAAQQAALTINANQIKTLRLLE